MRKGRTLFFGERVYGWPIRSIGAIHLKSGDLEFQPLFHRAFRLRQRNNSPILASLELAKVETTICLIEQEHRNAGSPNAESGNTHVFAITLSPDSAGAFVVSPPTRIALNPDNVLVNVVPPTLLHKFTNACGKPLAILCTFTLLIASLNLILPIAWSIPCALSSTFSILICCLVSFCHFVVLLPSPRTMQLVEGSPNESIEELGSNFSQIRALTQKFIRRFRLFLFFACTVASIFLVAELLYYVEYRKRPLALAAPDTFLVDDQGRAFISSSELKRLDCVDPQGRLLLTAAVPDANGSLFLKKKNGGILCYSPRSATGIFLDQRLNIRTAQPGEIAPFLTDRPQWKSIPSSIHGSQIEFRLEHIKASLPLWSLLLNGLLVFPFAMITVAANFYSHYQGWKCNFAVARLLRSSFNL